MVAFGVLIAVALIAGIGRVSSCDDDDDNGGGTDPTPGVVDGIWQGLFNQPGPDDRSGGDKPVANAAVLSLLSGGTWLRRATITLSR